MREGGREGGRGGGREGVEGGREGGMVRDHFHKRGLVYIIAVTQEIRAKISISRYSTINRHPLCTYKAAHSKKDKWGYPLSKQKQELLAHGNKKQQQQSPGRPWPPHQGSLATACLSQGSA